MLRSNEAGRCLGTPASIQGWATETPNRVEFVMDYSQLSSQELIRLCGEDGDAEQWREFISRFHRLIAATVKRSVRAWPNITAEIMQELTQEVYLKLCDRHRGVLLKFDQGSVEAYLTRVTANAVLDLLRARHTIRRNESFVRNIMETGDLPGRSDSEGSPGRLYRNVLVREIDDHFKAVTHQGQTPERDLFILREYYLNGRTAGELAELPPVRLTTKGVESIIHRLTCLVRRRLVEEAAGDELGT